VPNERFELAAQRVLAGDESVEAAQKLEGVLLDDYPGDERLDDLLEALALYAPGQAAPYVGAEGLRTAIREALTAVTGQLGGRRLNVRPMPRAGGIGVRQARETLRRMPTTPDGEAPRRRAHSIALVAVVGVGWILVAAISYFAIPLSGRLILAALLLYGLVWLFAVALSVGATIGLASGRRWVGAVGVLAGSTAAVILVMTADWATIYVNTQLDIHRGALAELAAQHRAGELDDDVQLPLRMRYLSIDGHAHMQHVLDFGDRSQDVHALYIPVWQSWRHENGFGLAHFVGPPPAGALLTTADWDVAGPTRPLGDGWWWVE
jgi:hypothetical protein